jgi:hypothetical protein
MYAIRVPSGDTVKPKPTKVRADFTGLPGLIRMAAALLLRGFQYSKYSVKGQKQGILRLLAQLHAPV